ncbi:MAG: hypothetical protein AAFN81_35180, partial [Bacteroidota bacterium]
KQLIPWDVLHPQQKLLLADNYIPRFKEDRWMTDMITTSILQSVLKTYKSVNICTVTFMNQVFETARGTLATKSGKTILRVLSAGPTMIIFPVVLDWHFFVYVAEFDPGTEGFLHKLRLYDSFKYTRSRSSHSVSKQSAQGEFLGLLFRNLNKFVFMEGKKLVLEDWLNNVERLPCPQQDNRYDCGLFAVGVSLRLAMGAPLGFESFTQGAVTGFRHAFGRSTTVREVLEVYGLADLAELLPGKSVDALLAWKEERVVKGRIGKEKNGAVVINSDYEDDDDDGEKGDSDAVVTMVEGVATAAAGGQSGNKKSGLGPMAASVVGGLGLDSKHESAVAQLALNNPEFKEELVAAATEATAVTQPAPSQATSPIISTEAPPAAALTTSGPPVDFVD